MRRKLAILVVLLVVGTGALSVLIMSKTASHDRDWASDHARLPVIAFTDNLATIQNIRNFAYSADGRVETAAYYDRTYDLREVSSVWYGISHFSDFEGLAHTFLSFGFSDGTFLSLSIEARREIEETYHPVRGLFREYELIYVLADERDVIGLRSHIRGERVLLYDLQIQPDVGARFLRALLMEAAAITQTPRFYTTLTDNCTTGIVRHARRVAWWRRVLDYRIVLPGYSDGLAHDLGLLGEDISLEEARSGARIDPTKVPLDSELFSAAIRAALG